MRTLKRMNSDNVDKTCVCVCVCTHGSQRRISAVPFENLGCQIAHADSVVDLVDFRCLKMPDSL